MGELELRGKLLVLAAAAAPVAAAASVAAASVVTADAVSPAARPAATAWAVGPSLVAADAVLPALRPGTEARVGSLIVGGAWSRPTPPGIAVGVVYLSISNRGALADRLQSARTPRAPRVEFHETREVKGTMQMRPVTSIDCPAGATVRSAPGGLHIMLLDLDAPLVAGSDFPIILEFENAGAVTVAVRVENRSP